MIGKSQPEKDPIKRAYSMLGEELFSPLDVSKRLNGLCRDIDDWALPGPITLMPTLPGSLWVCGQLQQRLRTPLILCPFGIVDRETQAFYLHSVISGKVLIVTDVIDSGKTLDIAGRAADKYGADEARIFALCHKGKVPPDSILCHYVGFKIPSKSYVVGSGMDFCGLLSNVQGIKKVKQ